MKSVLRADQLHMSNKWLYSGLWGALLLILLFSMGGGILGAESTLGHWTGDMFRNLCHQDPNRSFFINNLQMAVNSRCFGVFAGLFSGWALIPLYLKVKSKKNPFLWYLLLALIIQIIDYTGNLFGLWANNNESRFILGYLLGFTASSSVYDLFKS